MQFQVEAAAHELRTPRTHAFTTSLAYSAGAARAEDTMRFQVEAVAHELRNPGWFARWLARRSAPASAAPAGAARVKPPLSPWMAFVHVSAAFSRSLHQPTCIF